LGQSCCHEASSTGDHCGGSVTVCSTSASDGVLVTLDFVMCSICGACVWIRGCVTVLVYRVVGIQTRGCYPCCRTVSFVTVSVLDPVTGCAQECKSRDFVPTVSPYNSQTKLEFLKASFLANRPYDGVINYTCTTHLLSCTATHWHCFWPLQSRMSDLCVL
jgi:hypothetical protein